MPNTLVLAPATSSRDEEVCLSLLDGRDVIVIDLGSRPAAWYERLPSDAEIIEEDPGNFTALGVAVTGALRDANEPALCLYTITTMLQYASLKRVFRFLYILTQRTAEFPAHYHIAKDAHDPQTINTLSVLFDDVRDVSAEYDDIRDVSAE